MDETAFLFIGSLGGAVCFLTWRALILERRLTTADGEVKSLKKKALKLEDEKRGLESALADIRKKTEGYERLLEAEKMPKLGQLLKKAKRSVMLCIPELTEDIAELIPKKIRAQVITEKIGNVKKLRFSCATNPNTDVTLAIIDERTAYQEENGRIQKLKNVNALSKNFATLWNDSQVITGTTFLRTYASAGRARRQ